MISWSQFKKISPGLIIVTALKLEQNLFLGSIGLTSPGQKNKNKKIKEVTVSSKYFSCVILARKIAKNSKQNGQCQKKRRKKLEKNEIAKKIVCFQSCKEDIRTVH